MKKSEILKVLGERVESYYVNYGMLIVNVTGLNWADFSNKFVQAIIDIQPWDDDTIRVAFDYKGE